MFIVIRNDARVSRKAKFIVDLIKGNKNSQFFFVFKREDEKFREEWYRDHVQLASSKMAIVANYLLIIMRSPAELRDACMRRLSVTKPKNVLVGNGFFSMLRRSLYLRFGSSARVSMIMDFLGKIDPPRFFLIDEFFSINCLDLKKLKLLGPVVYVSQDVAYNRYDFAGNPISASLMFRLERDAIANFDFIIACSETERLKYLEMGAKAAVFYPNIYPTEGFEPGEKDGLPSISIVLQSHWGFKAEQSLEAILNALACLDFQIIVRLMGIRPLKVPKNVMLEYHEFMPSKIDYLNALSKSWIGINVGIHLAGTNERKYDYAEAGAVVLSDTLGARGDLLPHEYTYVDSHDLAAKLGQLLELGKGTLEDMGIRNRSHALFMANKGRQNLVKILSKYDF